MTKPRQGHGWKRAVRWGVVAVLFWVMLRWFEHSQVYHPYRAWDATGGALGRPWQDIEFRAADGVKLSAWYFPANSNSGSVRGAVLVCHGNGGNISHRLDLYKLVLDAGFSVLAFDYRGYGRSSGKPDEPGTYLDAQAAHTWLGQQGFAGTNILAYGESLGGAVAAELALRETLGGLVLQSTFTSIPDMGAALFPWLPVRLMASIDYGTRGKLPRIRVPVAILHGRADTLVPFRQAEQNYAAANQPKRLFEIAGDHNDPIELNRGKVLEAIQWLRVEQRQNPPPSAGHERVSHQRPPGNTGAAPDGSGVIDSIK